MYAQFVACLRSSESTQVIGLTPPYSARSSAACCIKTGICRVTSFRRSTAKTVFAGRKLVQDDIGERFVQTAKIVRIEFALARTETRKPVLYSGVRLFDQSARLFRECEQHGQLVDVRVAALRLQGFECGPVQRIGNEQSCNDGDD